MFAHARCCTPDHRNPVFGETMVEVLKGMGVDPRDALLLGSLKDPVRVHEKGFDDYFGRFEDGVIPEACVVDVVRARVILDDGPTLVKFLSRLRDGIEVSELPQIGRR